MQHETIINKTLKKLTLCIYKCELALIPNEFSISFTPSEKQCDTQWRESVESVTFPFVVELSLDFATWVPLLTTLHFPVSFNWCVRGFRNRHLKPQPWVQLQISRCEVVAWCTNCRWFLREHLDYPVKYRFNNAPCQISDPYCVVTLCLFATAGRSRPIVHPLENNMN
jgi:hypothetical protein